MESMYFLPISLVEGIVHTDKPFMSNTVIAIYNKHKNCVVIREQYTKQVGKIVEFLNFLGLLRPQPVILFGNDFVVDTWDRVLSKHGEPLQGEKSKPVVKANLTPQPVIDPVFMEPLEPFYKVIKKVTQEELSESEAILALNNGNYVSCLADKAKLYLELTSEFYVRPETKVYFFRPAI